MDTLCNMLDTYLKARYGTTVLAVRTNNEIIIGADSKATYGMLLKNYEKASVYQCEGKIHQAGAFFFSCSGLTGYEQQRFDAFDLARSVIKEGRTVSEIMMNLEQALGCSLFDAILDIHRKAPALLDPLLPEKGIKLSILVAGIENGLPVLALREFNPVIPSDPPECVINRNDNIRNDDGTPATWAIGAFDCIRQTLDDDPTLSSEKRAYRWSS